MGPVSTVWWGCGVERSECRLSVGFFANNSYLQNTALCWLVLVHLWIAKLCRWTPMTSYTVLMPEVSRVTCRGFPFAPALPPPFFLFGSSHQTEFHHLSHHNHRPLTVYHLRVGYNIRKPSQSSERSKIGQKCV